MTDEIKTFMLNSPDVYGRTPIVYAANVKMLDLFLYNGAVVTHKAKEYSTRNSFSDMNHTGVRERIYSRDMEDDNCDTRILYLQNWVTHSSRKKPTSSV